MIERLRWLLRKPDPVVREWEWYARRHSRERPRQNLGDEWNTPDVIGLDAPATDVVSYIDQTIVGPYVGRVDTLLEIGAGGGRFTEALLSRAKQLIAADTSPTMIKLLRARFRGQPQVSCLLLDGRGLAGVSDNSVDVVFAYDVLVHLSPWRIYNYLEEFRRVLRSNGRAVLHHANTFSPLGWRRFLRDAARVKAGESNQAQFTPLTPEFMAALARRAGFAVHVSVTSVVRRDCISILDRMETMAGVSPSSDRRL